MSDITKTVQEGSELDLWRKKDKIRQMFGANLTKEEFEIFVGLGASLGANPFQREIWCIKYGNNAAQIFLGRDFYRRKAQEQPDYNGHQVDAIYENDKFSVENGKVKHSYSLKDRGKLIGAYAVVYRSDNEPYFNVVEFSEYNTDKSLWKHKPATMIKKVAEAQALRGAFQGLFAGTYDASEEWEPELNPSNTESLPEKVRHLADRYPFDRTLKTPREDHRPYLNDGSEELRKVEQDIADGTLDPLYVRYFYTVTNRVLEYLKEIPQKILEADQKFEEEESELQFSSEIEDYVNANQDLPF